MTYPDGCELNLGYDELDRLKDVGDYASISYTLSDNVDTIAYGNGVVTSYTYDSRDRLTNILATKDSTTLLSLTYTYDKTGSVTSINNGTHTETYGYDLLDRLNYTSGPWGAVSYVYDPVGNRVSKAVQGGSTTSYGYDEVNRITSATGMGFTWDDNGNLLTWDDGVDDWSYRYDPANRLINAKKNGDLSAVYTYDADGRRVRSLNGDNVTDHVYSGLNVIDEVSGGLHDKHYYAGGLHLASNSSGTIEYYHQDHLGSTRLKTNSTGGVVYESNYEPYGPGCGESGSEEYRYTGKQEDPTGLYYFGARYYDPTTGRFTTRDTVFGDLIDPQSLNRYSYCRNNPHKYTDPDGRVADIIFGGIFIGAIGYMGRYAIGAYQGHYQFSAKYFMKEGIKGAVTGGLGAVGGVVTILAGGGIIVSTIVGGLTAAHVAALEPAVGGVVDILSGEDPDEVRKETADEVYNKLHEEGGMLVVETGVDFVDNGANGARLVVDQNREPIKSSFKPDSRSDPDPIIPHDYVDAAWRRKYCIL